MVDWYFHMIYGVSDHNFVKVQETLGLYSVIFSKRESCNSFLLKILKRKNSTSNHHNVFLLPVDVCACHVEAAATTSCEYPASDGLCFSIDGARVYKKIFNSHESRNSFSLETSKRRNINCNHHAVFLLPVDVCVCHVEPCCLDIVRVLSKWYVNWRSECLLPLEHINSLEWY